MLFPSQTKIIYPSRAAMWNHRSVLNGNKCYHTRCMEHRWPCHRGALIAFHHDVKVGTITATLLCCMCVLVSTDWLNYSLWSDMDDIVNIYGTVWTVAQHPYSTWDLTVIITGSPAQSSSLSCDADATKATMSQNPLGAISSREPTESRMNINHMFNGIKSNTWLALSVAHCQTEGRSSSTTNQESCPNQAATHFISLLMKSVQRSRQPLILRFAQVLFLSRL